MNGSGKVLTYFRHTDKLRCFVTLNTAKVLVDYTIFSFSNLTPFLSKHIASLTKH